MRQNKKGSDKGCGKETMGLIKLCSPASVCPYRLTARLLRRMERHGTRVFDRSLVMFRPHPQYGPRVLFALTYGGNGITYSMLGAGLLRAQIERRPHPLTALFSFARLGCS